MRHAPDRTVSYVLGCSGSQRGKLEGKLRERREKFEGNSRERWGLAGGPVAGPTGVGVALKPGRGGSGGEWLAGGWPGI
jgi:hypothetical protein